MHNELIFPIECSYRQAVCEGYTIGAVIVGSSRAHKYYEAMDNIDLIPSLVELVNKNSGKVPALRKWVKEYGLLTTPIRGKYREDTQDFWDKAAKLAQLWGLYQLVINRDLEGLKQVVSFTDEREEDINENLVSVMDPAPTAGHTFPSGIPSQLVYRYSDMTIYFKTPLEDIDKDPLRYYQYTAFHYVRRAIEIELRGVNMASKGIHPEVIEGKDYLKATPIIEAHTLLQALYLQFYILLNSTNKRICKECGRIFVPARSDQEYCPSPAPCKNTAKSRRFRDRKKAMKPIFETSQKKGDKK